METTVRPRVDGVKFAEKPPEEVTEVAEAKSPRKTIPTDWLPILDAPQDGKPVMLIQDAAMGFSAGTEAVWRQTSRFDRTCGRWRPYGFWAIRNSGGRPVEFEPVGFLAVKD